MKTIKEIIENHQQDYQQYVEYVQKYNQKTEEINNKTLEVDNLIFERQQLEDEYRKLVERYEKTQTFIDQLALFELIKIDEEGETPSFILKESEM